MPEQVLRKNFCPPWKWVSDEQGVKIEEQCREAQANNTNTRYHARTIAIEPDREGEPEKSDDIEDRECKHHHLYNIGWIQQRCHHSVVLK